MPKLPLILAGVIAVVAGIVAAFVFIPKSSSKPTDSDVASASQQVVQNSPVTNNYTQATQSADLEQQVASIAAQLAQLQAQVTKLQKAKPAQPTPSASPSTQYPLFIPVGSSSNTPSGVTTWQTLSNPTITLDTGTYPGYTSMQLQMNLLVYQGNGTAYARLVDVNSGVVLPYSTVSASNYTYTFVTSGNFQLFPGAHTYAVQVMTTTGYPVQFSDAKIQVNF